jgi:hypothetical protein
MWIAIQIPMRIAMWIAMRMAMWIRICSHNLAHNEDLIECRSRCRSYPDSNEIVAYAEDNRCTQWITNQMAVWITIQIAMWITI